MRPITALVLLLLTACASERAAQPSPTQTDIGGVNVTAAEADFLRAQIEPNFFYPSGTQCRTVMMIRAVLAPDGTVRSMDLMQKFPPEDDCAVVQKAAIRAITRASPLKLPPGKTWPSVVLRFDPDRAKMF